MQIARFASVRPKIALGACMLIPAISYGAFSSSFPLWVVPWIGDFHIQRSTAMVAFAVGNLVMGLASPAVGYALARAPARLIVTLGGFALALGFFLGSFAISFWQIIALYATIMALGTAFTGLLPAQTIAVSIAPHKAGTISGFIALGTSAGAIALPSILTPLIAALGWRPAFLVAGAIVLIIVAPAGWFLLSNYSGAPRSANGEAAEAPASLAGLELPRLLKNLAFWVPMMGVVPAMFVSGTILTNAVSIAADSGIAVGVAGYLVPAIAAGGAVGSVGLGWLCDRFDYRWVFATTAVAVSSALLLLLGGLGPLTMAMSFFVVGLVSGGVFPVVGVMVVRSFGAHAFARIMGMMMPPLIIANAVAPVIAGWARDLTGSYHAVFVYCAGLMLLSGTAVLTIRSAEFTGGNRVTAVVAK